MRISETRRKGITNNQTVSEQNQKTRSDNADPLELKSNYGNIKSSVRLSVFFSDPEI